MNSLTLHQWYPWNRFPWVCLWVKMWMHTHTQQKRIYFFQYWQPVFKKVENHRSFFFFFFLQLNKCKKKKKKKTHSGNLIKMEPDQFLYFCFNNHINHLYELVIKTVADYYYHHHYCSLCIICTIIIINLVLDILELSSQHQSKAKIRGRLHDELINIHIRSSFLSLSHYFSPVLHSECLFICAALTFDLSPGLSVRNFPLVEPVTLHHWPISTQPGGRTTHYCVYFPSSWGNNPLPHSKGTRQNHTNKHDTGSTNIWLSSVITAPRSVLLAHLPSEWGASIWPLFVRILGIIEDFLPYLCLSGCIITEADLL